MKKILILVRKFYPNISASGNLIKPLLEELSLENKVTVLCIDDVESCVKLNDNLCVKTLQHKDNTSYIKRIKSKILKNLKKDYYNSEIYRVIYNELTKKEYESYDLFIAITYEEMYALSSISKIEKNKKRIFLLEKFFYRNKRIPNKQNFIENKILSNIDTIYHLPILTKELNIYENTVCLEHPMIVDRTQIHKDNLSVEVCKIIYGGGVDKYQRNPINIINIINEINENVVFYFYIYGNLVNKLSNINSNLVKVNAPIPHDEFIEKVHESNILLSIGNKESDIVPSKVFDYISTGKPILHFSFNSNDPYYYYLSRYRLSLIIDYKRFLNDLDYKQTISIELNNFIESYGFTNESILFDEIKSNYIECTPNYVKDQILDDRGNM